MKRFFRIFAAISAVIVLSIIGYGGAKGDAYMNPIASSSTGVR